MRNVGNVFGNIAVDRMPGMLRASPAAVAGVKQFTDAWVREPAVVALSHRIVATVDPAIGEAQARVAVALRDGRRIEQFVEHAVGSGAAVISRFA
jgi:hypothetical protein